MKRKRNRKPSDLEDTPQRKGLRAVNRAVKNGLLPHVSTQTCVECDQQAVNYHHHRGYAKENILDVIPVCAKHHAAMHKRLRYGHRHKDQLVLPMLLA